MSCYKWMALTVSLVMAMFCGIASSFPVYAVKLKISFHLSQSQVERVAAFCVMGWSFQIVTAWVIRRFGYQACYILVLCLTTSTSLLMWVATQYVSFFRKNNWLMCLIIFLNTAGTTGGFQCVSAIASRHFNKKHSGKVIAIYMAAFGLGRAYYSVLFQIFFDSQESLGHFFLTLAISLTSLMLLCYFVHRQPINESPDSDRSELLRRGSDGELIDERTSHETDEKQSCQTENKSVLRDLFSSSFFYLMGGSYVLYITGTHTFMNNITNIGTAVRAKDPLDLVNILSIGMVISRLTLGALYDYFGSMRSGFTLVFIQCLIFFFSIIICLFWLDGSTVYWMVAVASIGCGAGYFLFLIMLLSEFGIPAYPIITGILDAVYAPAVLFSHLAAGWTYDNAAARLGTKDLFCKECFYGTYLVVLSLTTAVFLLQVLNAAICYAKSSLKNHGSKF